MVGVGVRVGRAAHDLDAARDLLLLGRLRKELEDALTLVTRLLLPWKEVEAYAEVEPGNARMRWLYDDVISREAWKIGWVPPSFPYYKLDPPFSNSRSLQRVRIV